MSSPVLDGYEGVYVLRLGDDENRFSPTWLDLVESALDDIVSDPAPVVTIGAGKQYSSGLDIEYVLANPGKLTTYTARVQALFARVLTLPVPTVAALNGHAFGAGAMLALAHDRRVMRSDRGYFCFPEVDINIPFTPGMADLIQSKVSPRTAMEAMTTGRRYTGPQAVDCGIAERHADSDQVLTHAIATMTPLIGKCGQTLGQIKATMYRDVVTALEENQ